MNFDWINQIKTNDTHDDGNIFQSLDLDSTELDNSGGQDIINYLFDSTNFPAPLDSSSMTIATSPEGNSSNGTADGDSPKSATLATSNHNSSNSNDNNNINSFSSLTTLDQSWLIAMDPQLHITTTSSNPTPPTTKSTTPTTASSGKLRLKQIREPIFVTEKPQNAYKKRTRNATTRCANASSTSSNLPLISKKEQQKQPQQQSSSSSQASPSEEEEEDMDINDPSDKRHLSSKEKRLLRNKISARNFRVRRKEYIKQLENLVDQQEDEISSLRKENKRLTNLNQQMVQEVLQLKLQQAPNVAQPPQLQQQQLNQPQPQQQLQQQYLNLLHCHPVQASMMTSPPTSETNSPPDIMDTLLDFNLFTNNTYLSHSLMPDFDLSCVLGDKLKTPPPSTQLEDHRELMTMYPLLAPTLASMVLRHTFTLHYAAFLSNAFPYNSSRPKNEPVDIMHLDDWMTAASSSLPARHDGGNGDDPDKNGKANMLSTHVVQQIEYNSTTDDDDNNNNDDTWTREFERSILRQHYPYYAFMRLRGLSHNEVIRRCQASMQRKMAAERQRRRKATPSCSKWQAIHGFTAVAATLLRNPSRSPMIASVIQDTKACQISPRNIKSKVPLITASPLRTLRIGGGKA